MLIQEDYFRNIFNAVRGAILILDENLRVLSANRSFFTIFKVDAANTIGTLLYDLGNGQWNIPHLRVLLEDVLPNNDTVDDYEIVHDFESIGQKTMLLNACKIREKEGAQPIILLAIEDITEHKRLQDLLSESEERYRRLFETASDGIVLLEKSEGHITNVNPSSEEMTGFSKKESVGKHLQDIGVSIDMSDFTAIMQSLNYYGIMNYTDVPVKTKSGQEIFTDIYLVDRALVAQCNIRDVTERKLACEELKREQALSSAIIDSIPDAFYLLDESGRFVRWNSYLREVILGKPEDQVAGTNVADIIHPDDLAQLQLKIANVLENGIEGNMEVRVLLRGGPACGWFLTTGRQMMINGRPLLVGVGIDITEQKKLEDQLLQSQKMEAVGTLAGGIAHDFNNSLNVIMGYGSIVMDKMEAGNPAKEQMSQILIAADRAAELTKRLLVFSRKQVVEMKAVNINALIVGLQKMLVRIIQESINFNLELTVGPLTVMADAGQIEQVLINLASNARDAMQEGGRLTIGTELEEMDDEYFALYGYGKPGKYALITVSDTGQGMDAETQKKIFDPFFTTKGIGEGTGLGLSISYGIIKQHNGYIKVYSETGRGTTFKIWLPVIEDMAEKKPDAETLSYPKGGTETILVAEDDAFLRKLSKIVLESNGYSVITAEDGEDAITKFMENRESISLVLLDMIMPKKNGKEVGETIRKVSPQIKIIFASGYTMDIIKTRELTESGFDFLLKPVVPRDLLRKAREILDR